MANSCFTLFSFVMYLFNSWDSVFFAVYDNVFAKDKIAINDYHIVLMGLISWLSFPTGAGLGLYYFFRKNKLDYAQRKLSLLEETTNRLRIVCSSIFSAVMDLSDPSTDKTKKRLQFSLLINEFYLYCDILYTLKVDSNYVDKILKLYSFLDKIEDNIFFEAKENITVYIAMNKDVHDCVVEIRQSYLKEAYS